jgi:hypothetical protein
MERHKEVLESLYGSKVICDYVRRKSIYFLFSQCSLKAPLANCLLSQMPKQQSQSSRPRYKRRKGKRENIYSEREKQKIIAVGQGNNQSSLISTFLVRLLTARGASPPNNSPIHKRMDRIHNISNECHGHSETFSFSIGRSKEYYGLLSASSVAKCH